MANYITTLENRVNSLESALESALETVAEIQAYYCSSKFHIEDSAYVSTDVLPRLMRIQQALLSD